MKYVIIASNGDDAANCAQRLGIRRSDYRALTPRSMHVARGYLADAVVATQTVRDLSETQRWDLLECAAPSLMGKRP